jgi:hypothetical protein
MTMNASVRSRSALGKSITNASGALLVKAGGRWWIGDRVEYCNLVKYAIMAWCGWIGLPFNSTGGFQRYHEWEVVSIRRNWTLMYISERQ